MPGISRFTHEEDERIINDNFRRNKLAMCRDAKVPHNSQGLLALTRDEAIPIWVILFMEWRENKSLVPSETGSASRVNIAILQALIQLQQEHQNCFIKTADLSREIGLAPTSQVTKKRIAALVESGLIIIQESRRDGNVYELSPLLDKIRAIQERELTANANVLLFPV